MTIEDLMKSNLASLGKDLEYKVEPISAADFYYTDGLAVGSCLKLILEKKGVCTSIYFFPSGTYIPCGYLSNEDRSILDGWLETLRSKKLNSQSPSQAVTSSTK